MWVSGGGNSQLYVSTFYIEVHYVVIDKSRQPLRSYAPLGDLSFRYYYSTGSLACCLLLSNIEYHGSCSNVVDIKITSLFIEDVRYLPASLTGFVFCVCDKPSLRYLP